MNLKFWGWHVVALGWFFFGYLPDQSVPMGLLCATAMYVLAYLAIMTELIAKILTEIREIRKGKKP